MFLEILNKAINLFADELKINTPDLVSGGFLTATTNWGILRGLETFVQLLHPTDDFTAVWKQLNNIVITAHYAFVFEKFSAPD